MLCEVEVYGIQPNSPPPSPPSPPSPPRLRPPRPPPRSPPHPPYPPLYPPSNPTQPMPPITPTLPPSGLGSGSGSLPNFTKAPEQPPTYYAQPPPTLRASPPPIRGTRSPLPRPPPRPSPSPNPSPPPNPLPPNPSPSPSPPPQTPAAALATADSPGHTVIIASVTGTVMGVAAIGAALFVWWRCVGHTKEAVWKVPLNTKPPPFIGQSGLFCGLFGAGARTAGSRGSESGRARRGLSPSISFAGLSFGPPRRRSEIGRGSEGLDSNGNPRRPNRKGPIALLAEGGRLNSAPQPGEELGGMGVATQR